MYIYVDTYICINVCTYKCPFIYIYIYSYFSFTSNLMAIVIENGNSDANRNHGRDCLLLILGNV